MTPKRQKLYDVAPEAAPLVEAVEVMLDAAFLDREACEGLRLPIALQGEIYLRLHRLHVAAGRLYEVRQNVLELIALLGIDDDGIAAADALQGGVK
jgi:hypothetical protein